MMKIDKRDYMMMQPGYPDESEADKFYFGMANEMASALDNSELLRLFGEPIVKDVVLAVTGYFQDIVADAGIWRSFCTIHKHLYGRLLPFFTLGDDYVESELNMVDVQFITWYVVECSLLDNGTVSPFHPAIAEAAATMHRFLDNYYDFAPVAADYNMMADIDIYDQEQIRQVYDFSYWLFWNSYFMRHAAAPTMRSTLLEGQKIVAKNPDPDTARPLLLELNHNTMSENPTGPLALYVREWLSAIIDNKLPAQPKPRPEAKTAEPHKFYKQMMKANDGKPIRFIADYAGLNKFLIDHMGWKPDGTDSGFFPNLAEMHNFTLYATPERGLLIAPETAQYIKHPDNQCYDSAEAAHSAHELVTVHGRCPIDLLKFAFYNGLLPDARFIWDESGHLLIDNWDFLARLYQQNFYRAQ